MNQKNVIFANVYDWLRKENMIAGQKDLAKKTGITENTLTNILNGKTSVSDKTIHKLNEGFGFIFNPQYFRGQSIHLLMEDVAYYEQHPEEDISKPKQKEPDWMDAMLYRQTQQEKEMEELRRMLKATLEKVDMLTQKLDTLLRTSNYQIQTPQGAYLTAAEPNKNK